MYLGYAYCKVPIAPIMVGDTHRCEMTSQLLFGEGVFIIEHDKSQRWYKVITQNDDVEGWIIAGQLEIIAEKKFRKPNKYITSASRSLLFNPINNGAWIPYGSELPHIKSNKFYWLPDTVFKGSKSKLIEQTSFASDIIANAALYLGAPYMWGGRSIAGIDCSGLVQMTYKLCNILLPRNAAEQVSVGETIDFLDTAQPGDIAFFDDEEGRIIHTGIIYDDGSIIHASEASGRVVIDALDNGGIINLEHKRRTHKLRVIKRIIDYIK